MFLHRSKRKSCKEIAPSKSFPIIGIPESAFTRRDTGEINMREELRVAIFAAFHQYKYIYFNISVEEMKAINPSPNYIGGRLFVKTFVKEWLRAAFMQGKRICFY